MAQVLGIVKSCSTCERQRKESWVVSSRECMQNDMSRQTLMSARLPCLQQESRTKPGEARLRWGQSYVLSPFG